MLGAITTLILFFSFIAMLAYAVYIKLHERSNTRERFAFYAVGGMISLGTLAIKSISQHESIWQSMGNFVRSLSGETPIPADQPPWTDHALIVVVFMSACYYITSLYKNWEGELSVEDYIIGEEEITTKAGYL